MAEKKKCVICKKSWYARADALTCSPKCKSKRHYQKVKQLKEVKNEAGNP